MSSVHLEFQPLYSSPKPPSQSSDRLVVSPSFIPSVPDPSQYPLLWLRHQRPPAGFPGKDGHISGLSSVGCVRAPWPLLNEQDAWETD